MRTIGMFLVLTCLVACTQKEEDVLAQAVKDYRMNGLTVEDAVKSQIEAFQKKGIVVEDQWVYKKVNEETYQLVVRLQQKASKKTKPLEYVWRLDKNLTKSNSSKGSVWTLKPHNRNARKFVREQYARKFASLDKRARR